MFYLPVRHPSVFPWGKREKQQSKDCKKEEIRYEYEFINGFYRPKEIREDDGGNSEST